MVCKPNLVKCFGPRLRLWTRTLDFVPGPSFSIKRIYKRDRDILNIPSTTAHRETEPLIPDPGNVFWAVFT